MTSDTPPPKNPPKEAKLAEALRANLRRRKQGRAGSSPAADADGTPTETASS